MDYLGHFKLREEPFSNAPLPRFYYASRQHTDALNRLLYAARSMKGLAVLVGDIGRGKTTLARRLLDQLPEDEFEAAMLVIVHAGITATWLLKRIAMQLGVSSPADDKLAILSQLHERLIEIHESGKRAVVLIDEAQMLDSRELMEEFRGLLNMEVPERKLISFVFFGLPELEQCLLLDPPLAQRVALRYHLQALSEDDTVAYVNHRLRLAGASSPMIEDGGLRAVHRYTSGIPRLINTLCDNVLLELYFAHRETADATLVTQVAQNLTLGEFAQQAAPITVPSVIVPEIDVDAGADAVVAIEREVSAEFGVDSTDDVARRVASEPLWDWEEDKRPVPALRTTKAPRLRLPERGAQGDTTVDIEDPLAFLGSSPQPVASQEREPAPAQAPEQEPDDHVDVHFDVDIEVDVEAADERAADEHAADEHAADEHAADEHAADEHAAEAAFMASVGVVEVLSTAVPARASVPVALPVVPAIPAAPVAPTRPAGRTSKGIDLDEIDNLLAELKR